MRPLINRTAHAIAQRHELETREALEKAIRELRRNGAAPEAVDEFLAACVAAGAVVEAPMKPGAAVEKFSRRLKGQRA